ncbi:type VII toxin-antitoxin system MntA family adenylyltransferase antitoxin [Clostridium sp. DJ247]|uniref:type VII toxin-antitoxin system MntA family adenylyltransferase antitoxin n=1 Tax=Clostridium sp. DJ247 TaxID=2726188 RepID=UPI001627CD47|nr:nucleotidyltransferase domain-containing protein [Clostridium sp. DJ247]MBC2578868.1 nucleotidyltransferase domain-containing protein [Clostridium sp. DJ247]
MNVEPYVIYLFGSGVKGIFRQDSDIDIAFLSDKEISDYDLFMVSQELADILKREVDLINLKNASTVFKVQVIYNGEKIYYLDDTRGAYFEMYSFKDYALLNEEREIILNSIRERGSIYE